MPVSTVGVMRCQRVDDDIRCRFDATRGVLVVFWRPTGTPTNLNPRAVYMVDVKEHDPHPRRSMPLPRTAGSVPIGERPVAVALTRSLSPVGSRRRRAPEGFADRADLVGRAVIGDDDLTGLVLAHDASSSARSIAPDSRSG